MRRLILSFPLLFTYHFVSAQINAITGEIKIENIRCYECEKEVETKSYNAGKDHLELYPEYQTYRLTFDHDLCSEQNNDSCKRSYGRYTETDSTIVLHSWLQKGHRTDMQQFVLRYMHEKSLSFTIWKYANYYLEKRYKLKGLSEFFWEKLYEKPLKFYVYVTKQYQTFQKQSQYRDGKVLYPMRPNGDYDSLTLFREFFYLSDCILEKKEGGSLVSKDPQLPNYVFGFDINQQPYHSTCWGFDMEDFACFKAAIETYYTFCLPLWE